MVEWYRECRKMINLLSLISIILNLFICVINQYKYLIFIVINQIRLALTSILVIKKKRIKSNPPFQDSPQVTPTTK